MQGTGERLKTLIKSSGYSNKAFAEKIGVSPNYISILIGKGELNDKFLYSIRKVIPDLNTDWLLNGEGEMFIGSNVVNEDPAEYLNLEDIVLEYEDYKVPLKVFAIMAVENEELLKKVKIFSNMQELGVAKKLAEITSSAEALRSYLDMK